MGISAANYNITLDGSIRNLACYILIAEPYNKPILGSIIFIFILKAKSPSQLIVGFTLPTPLKFNLEAAVVGTTFQNLILTHLVSQYIRKLNISEESVKELVNYLKLPSQRKPQFSNGSLSCDGLSDTAATSVRLNSGQA